MSDRRALSRPDLSAVPAELKAIPQWVRWRSIPALPKPRKVPFYATENLYASVSSPSGWGCYEDAVSNIGEHGTVGVGFVFTESDPYAGVDLDNCRDPQTGELTPTARAIVASLATYTEVSPSGTGLKLIMRGSVDAGRKVGNYEAYSTGRYFTVTGRHVEGAPLTVMGRQVELDAFAARYLPASGSRGDHDALESSELPPCAVPIEERVKRATAYARKLDPAVSGQGGHDTTLRSAVRIVRGFVLDVEHALDILEAEFNPRCVPPWSRRELLHKLKDAFKKGRMEWGELLRARLGEVRDGGVTTTQRVCTWLKPQADDWPEPMDDVAFHGLGGAFVRLVEPHTEADPAALLVQFLVAFGNAVGRGAYFRVGATRHRANEFAALVGETGKGRKGTSDAEVRRPFALIEDSWISRVTTGLSSGEGLIWEVRDAIEKQEPIRGSSEKGRRGPVTGYESVTVDPGIADKRLLVVESELGRVLRVMERDGNTLSATCREAWDSATTLRTMTKNTPAVSTEAHVSLVGHITRDELLRYLDRTETANGFGNRFLWVAVRRSKELPDGGSLADRDLSSFSSSLRRVLEMAREVREMTRSDEAAEIWRAVYGPLSAGRPGLVGAITGRAEAHVLRLSMIYALLDGTSSISPEHLHAALAVWTYSEASARFVFGESTGDPEADEILRALIDARSDGLTRAEMHAVFGRNLKAERLSRALALLHRHQLARGRSEQTEGRAAERWFASRYAHELNEKDELSPSGPDARGRLNSSNSSISLGAA